MRIANHRWRKTGGMKQPVQPTETANNSKDDTINEAGLIAFLAGGDETEATEEAEETEEEPEEETETDEVEETETEAEETEEEAEAQGLDLDNLTEEEWDAIRAKLKSGAAARIGKLTAQLKAKEETISALKTAQPQQAPAPEEVQSRFLEGIESVEDLTAKVSELKKLGKETARLLLDHEDYGPNDIIEVGEKKFTKRQLRALDLEVRETLDEAVPFKSSQLHRSALLEQEAIKVEAKLKEEVKELDDEESPIAKGFKELTALPVYQKIINSDPEAKVFLPYLVGHALRSIHGKTAKAIQPVTAAKTPKAKPPGTPSSVAAGSPKADKSGGAKMRERAEQTGSREDLEKYLESIL